MSDGLDTILAATLTDRIIWRPSDQPGPFYSVSIPRHHGLHAGRHDWIVYDTSSGLIRFNEVRPMTETPRVTLAALPDGHQLHTAIIDNAVRNRGLAAREVSETLARFNEQIDALDA